MMADDWFFQHDESRDRGRPTAKTCFRCGKEGHIARHCPTCKDTRRCYNCSEEGHISRDCTNKRRTKQDCYSRKNDSPGIECYSCYERGHISRNCPQKRKCDKKEDRESSRKKTDSSGIECYNCYELGHISRNCPQKRNCDKKEDRESSRKKTASPEVECYNCYERSHVSRNRPQTQTCDKKEDIESSIKRNAEELKERGNKYYQEKNYGEAIKCYAAAIKLSPNCSKYYGNRSACYMKMNNYTEALGDAKESVRIDPKFIKGYLRIAKCHMQLGDPTAAIIAYRKVLQLEPYNDEAEDGLQMATRQNVTNTVLAMKEEGNRSFQARNYKKAYTIYTEALTIDVDDKIIKSQLFMNRGTACKMIGKENEAIADFTKAIKLDDSYLKAYFRRANCYMEMKKYQEAVNDYEKVCQMDCTSENKRLLEEAQSALKKSRNKDSGKESSKDNSKDYYKILNVSRCATDDEIKKAYKKKALSHHPDRHSHVTVDVRKNEEIKFKEVGEAFAVLSCPTKRMQYNLQYDLEHSRDFRENNARDRYDPVFDFVFGGRRQSQHFPFGGGGSTYTGGFPTWETQV
ncbi:dnaJ homolog subfamily C member 7-like isoform X1 [Dreissena polymorpha]|nr:dnaJ homolog subfamily C member 7-like isoform X1 [Dreissena polymorpha]XP_052227933.1 dnaJ homolog subfamily C member 7-like isoform X1 [Dreissena polymorpha]XP_052227934.1 dnaJ homolog subfamily C member 7-like isoform X1 [Dreissena polymorpha]